MNVGTNVWMKAGMLGIAGTKPLRWASAVVHEAAHEVAHEVTHEVTQTRAPDVA